MRYFIEFQYKGTNYHGWQYQPKAVSVQETLTTALSTLLRTNTELVGAGRTDAGVHAKQMFAHFDSDNELNTAQLRHKINSFLPKDIAVFNIFRVSNNAHARFDAVKRTYQYHIHTQKNAFITDDSWYYALPLDLKVMNEACRILQKHRDFESFSRTNTDVNTFLCNIYHADWKQTETSIVFTIAADRFLRNMVRAIVGTMILVGSGKISLSDFNAIIESKNRSNAGFSAPAHGLFLTKIEYPFL